MTQYCDVNRRKSTEIYGGISLEVLNENHKKLQDNEYSSQYFNGVTPECNSSTVLLNQHGQSV
jgi:hypothetical protein